MIRKRIDSLLSLMETENIDTYIITKSDPHQSEYGADYYNGVSFISGFTGSRGLVVVTKKETCLWTDGRYFIQAYRQLKNTDIILQKENHPNVLDYMSYIKENTPDGGVIGFDGETMSSKETLSLLEKVESKNITLQTEKDLLNKIWEDRPKFSDNKIYEHDIIYSGKPRTDKINETRKIMKKENIDIYLISSLDDIAWLFNLRGNDVENNTTFSAYAVITNESAAIFTDKNKLSDCISNLQNDNIIVEDYEKVSVYINSLNHKNILALNLDKTNYSLYNKLQSFKIKKLKIDITTNLKACKNPVEIQNIKNANIRDSVYMLRFIKWIKENIGKKEITEYDIDAKLIELRSKDKRFLFPSFNTIAAYMENAAMMHYQATKDKNKKLEAKGFLLVDSGGQYLDGTTDVTRTIVLGEITDQMKRDFTLTLKSNINLAKAIFLEGVSGVNLDILARQPMWNNKMDYKCGTGHGIGNLLSVHEGPQNISTRIIDAPLKEGMILSNEPGVYRENEYGIRIETTILVKQYGENDFGKFLCFETISPCPIDIDGIDVSLLTQDEIKWINAFHENVYEKLSPYLNEDELNFLKNETVDI